MTHTLYHGDCLKEMDRIEAGSVDMILADLPFNTTACVWDKLIPFEPLWAQYKRILKKSGACVLFGSQPFTSLLVVSNLEWFKYEWIWYGAFGASDRTIELDETMPQSIIEGIYTTNIHERGLHPTQKPVALLEYLILTYSNEGDTILDNTMGSGSTGEAALRTNRHFIGIELYPLPGRPIGDDNPDYFGIAQRRLDDVARELRGEWKPLNGNGHKIDDLPLFKLYSEVA